MMKCFIIIVIDVISDASHKLLLQTTCIVLTPLLMRQLGSHHGYVDVVDGLIAQG